MRRSKNTCLNLKCWPCCLTHKNLNKSRSATGIRSLYARYQGIARKKLIWTQDLDCGRIMISLAFCRGKSFFLPNIFLSFLYLCNINLYSREVSRVSFEKYLVFLFKNRRANPRQRRSITLCVQLKYYNLLIVTF